MCMQIIYWFTYSNDSNVTTPSPSKKQKKKREKDLDHQVDTIKVNHQPKYWDSLSWAVMIDYRVTNDNTTEIHYLEH